MNRFVRITTVTLGLIVVGAAAGAMAGTLPLLVAGLLPEQLVPSDAVGFLLPISGAVGAGLGILLGPAIAWGMLRHVPLGRAVGFTFLGALGGGTLGLVLISAFVLMPIVGAIGGTLVAVTMLAAQYSPSDAPVENSSRDAA